MPSRMRPVMYGPEWVLRRQEGRRFPIGSNFAQVHQYASSYDYNLLYSECKYGGVFNLEYSPQNSLLIAATEHKTLLLCDPYRQSIIKSIPNAHQECINGVKFLDHNTFSTCSDDTTAAIWDLRNTDQKVHELRRHKNWVKSIDKVRDGIITSSFDGNILKWDLTDSLARPAARRLFQIDGLIRSKLSPDGTKLVVSSSMGFIVVIHNLDLETIADDLKDFTPLHYRLMQVTEAPIKEALPFTKKFQTPGQRNRIEFISDFPAQNDAEIITSLDIFPDSSHLLNRNTSHGDVNEFTCVHSLLEMEDQEGEQVDEAKWSESYKPLHPSYVIPSSRLSDPLDPDTGEITSRNIWTAFVTLREARLSRARRNANPRHGRSNLNLLTGQPDSSAQMRVHMELNGSIGRNSQPRHRFQMISVTRNQQANSDRPFQFSITVEQDGNNADGRGESDHISFDNETPFDFMGQWIYPNDPRIHKNKKKMIGYIEEPNTGRSYIKEQSISRDGRLIASPYKNGIRILSLSSRYQDPWQHDPNEYPQPLNVVKVFPVGPVDGAHGDSVLCSKLSLFDNQVVAGTLSGKILIFNPLRE